MNQLEKQKFLHDYAESLKGKTLEELKAIEQELIKDAEATDKEVSEIQFDMPTENYKVVAEAVQKILNKVKVGWSMTFAMMSMYDFWNPAVRQSKIAYPMLDGTLRTIGNLEFTGYEEWCAVVAVNKYFEPLRTLYTDATEKVYDIAAKHDALMNQMKLVAPVESTEVPDAIQVGEE